MPVESEEVVAYRAVVVVAAAALVVEDTARNVVAPSTAVGKLRCYYTRVLNLEAHVAPYQDVLFHLLSSDDALCYRECLDDDASSSPGVLTFPTTASSFPAAS